MPFSKLVDALASISKFYIFETILGIGILIVDFYVYLNYYYEFKGKDNLGFILSIMLILGIIFLSDGFSRWNTQGKIQEKLEKIRASYEIKE